MNTVDRRSMAETAGQHYVQPAELEPEFRAMRVASHHVRVMRAEEQPLDRRLLDVLRVYAGGEVEVCDDDGDEEDYEEGWW